VIRINDEEIREAMRKGTIATTVADSGATSSIGTEGNPSKRTRKPSTKEFKLPNGEVVTAKEIAEYPFDVQKPANELHITPGISENSLLSTSKYADAGCITIFENDMVNVYGAQNTMITVSREAVLRGWQEDREDLWQIPIVDTVQKNNTDTTIFNKPPTEFLPDRPEPSEAVHNVYTLKTQPELVRYHHTAAGFPTKPTFLAAIKNKQFPSWPGLTINAVRKHFP
jgi:hypothetical protein